VNGHAVRLLPADAPAFFEKHKKELIEQSVEPDLWKRKGHRHYQAAEGPRHYINIDRFMAFPFAGFPENRVAAEARFGKREITDAGTVPWRIEEVFQFLVDALKRHNRDDILRWASALGHYAADIHVPLHVTKNHDGEETGNKGIHARFESDLLEAFEAEFDARSFVLASILSPGRFKPFLPRPGELLAADQFPIADRISFAFGVVRESYAGIAPILEADKRWRQGNAKRSSKPYLDGMKRDVGHILIDRLAKSALATSRLWYTAWIAAGRPDLGAVSDSR
jgi:hypothetical protein